jgi:electron transfer flavoprotein alpha subunit/NAD-dependent dihydropyrimidine dehydrogenase PreA subunit
MGIRVLEDQCTGCGNCLPICPFGCLELVGKKAVIREGCTLCGACQEVCPFEAISIEREAAIATPGIEKHQGVLVFAEQHGGRLRDCALELLGAGQKLAGTLHQELAAALMGSEVETLCPILFAHGADKVYLLEEEELKQYHTEPYADALSGVITQYKPSIVLFGATTTGRDLAPRIAARLRTGLTADCTGLEIEDKTGFLLQVRPAFGGNIMATIKCANHRPQMATVRPKVMKKPVPDFSRRGEIIRIDGRVDSKSLRTRILQIIEAADQMANLEEAEIVVSGGRGLEKAENFHLLEELARVFGGSVGASRAAVDAGWKPHPFQVGQTGKTVCPKLYIACGISGAIQHLVGMQTSDIVVAINKDPEAPILKVADFGIVGDLFQVVPALTHVVRKLKGGETSRR